MLPKSCSFDELAHKKDTHDVHYSNGEKRLRKAHSEEGPDIFEYLNNGISKSISQFSGILKIAAPRADDLETNENEKIAEIRTLKGRFFGFFKKNLRIIPVMRTAGDIENKKKEASKIEKTSEKPPQNLEKNEMMDSEEAVYEIDELNSTIAPSSSRQCIVGADLECAPPKSKVKKTTMQRTEFHPKPPFSCVPIYTAILLGLLIVLIIGAVTTIVDMRPEFIYGKVDNETTVIHLLNEIEMSTLKPQ